MGYRDGIGRGMRLTVVMALALALAPADRGSVAARAATLPQPLPRLGVERGGDPIIRTADGRQALMRGVNVNQLGDYFAVRPDLPTVVPLTARDFRQIAKLGFDHVRLVLSWSALEPRRGTLDATYLRRIRQAVRWAASAGLHVVLDMHQDAWGKGVSSGEERCAPGLTPAQGWDGAPAWATFTDGLTGCRVRLRELAPAVGQAWTSFYVNRNGIRSALATTWGRLARAFAADPAIAGYDLLNEPNTGYLPAAVAPTLLSAFYADAITAIRKAERSVAGGFSHLVFFEPTVAWSAAAVDTVPLPGFTSDPDIVFAPHLYGGSITADRALGISLISVEDGFRTARLAAGLYRTALWSGEYGWFGSQAADEPSVLRYAAAEDASRTGGAWWSWRQACGDPHQYTLPSRDPLPRSPSLNPYDCPSGRGTAPPSWQRRILGRARPRYAPGRLTALVSDPLAGTMTLSGRDTDRRGSCVLDVWVPGAARPRVTGQAVRAIRLRRVPGGWRVTGCATARGGYSLHVTA